MNNIFYTKLANLMINMNSNTQNMSTQPQPNPTEIVIKAGDATDGEVYANGGSLGNLNLTSGNTNIAYGAYVGMAGADLISGGVIDLHAGDINGTSISGGRIFINGGNNDTNTGGYIDIQSGNNTFMNGSRIYMEGASSNGGLDVITAGDIEITAGNNNANTIFGGQIYVNGVTNSTAGDIEIIGGNTIGINTSGSVNLTAGDNGSKHGGQINILGADGTHDGYVEIIKKLSITGGIFLSGQ